MIKKSLAIKLASLIITSGIGLGIFGSQYFQRTSTDFNGKIGGYYLKKGFKITSYNDSIWGEEFERYKKFVNIYGPGYFNEEELTSVQKLKDKCKELTRSKLNHPINDGDDLMAFAATFCMGRTTLKNWMKQNAQFKEINIDGDEDIWDNIASNIDEDTRKEMKISNNISDKEELKKEIKNYCKGVNWNQEIRLVDEEKMDTISYFCMFPKLNNVNQD